MPSITMLSAVASSAVGAVGVQSPTYASQPAMVAGPGDAALSANAASLAPNVLASQARFEKAMDVGRADGVARVEATRALDLADTAAVTDVSPTPSASSMPSQVADRILASLRSVSINTHDMWNSANRIANVDGQASAADLLQLQGKILETMVSISYFGKLINKSTQIVDQLVKTQ